MMVRDDWKNDDAPWWYNERASLSQLAGAIWRCDRGWVFEEYAITRGPRVPGGGTRPRGRCDFMFELGNLRVVSEAKQVWLPATRDNDFAARVREALEASWRQVVGAPNVRGTYDRWGIVFAVPFVTRTLVDEPQRLAARLNQIAQELGEAFPDAARAWAFPANKRDLESARFPGTFYPGVVMLLAPLRRR